MHRALRHPRAWLRSVALVLGVAACATGRAPALAGRALRGVPSGVRGPVAGGAPSARPPTAAGSVARDRAGRIARARAMAARIDSLHDAGLEEVAWRRARAMADSALAAGDTVLAERVLTAGSRARLVLAGPDSALGVLDRARDLAVAAGDTGGWMNALGFRSIALAWRGDLDGAERAARTRLRLARRTGDVLGAGWSHVSIAYAALHQGRVDTARVHYEAAESLFVRAGNARARVTALIGAGRAASLAADDETARKRFARARRLAEAAGDWRQELDALNNLASIEFRRGDMGRAAEMFDEVYRARLAHEDERGALVPATNVARAYVALGRFGAARAVLERMLEACRARGFADALAMLQVTLGNAMLAQGNASAAAERFRAAIEGGAASPRVRDDAYVGLARALLSAGRLEEATRVIERALAMAPLPETRPVLLVLASRCARRGGRLADARRRCAEARRQTRSMDPVARFDAALEWGRVHAAMARTLDAEDGRDPVRVARASLREAVALEDSVRRRTKRYEWREAVSRMRTLVDLAADVIDASAPRVDGGPGRAGVRRREAAPALAREVAGVLVMREGRTLLERAMATDARVADSLLSEKPPSLERVQAALRRGELALDVAMGGERAVVCAITRDTVRAWVVPAADARLCERIGLVRDAIVSPASAIVRARGSDGAAWPRAAVAALVEALFGPARDAIAGAERIVLVPDGCVSELPVSLVAAVSACDRWTACPSLALLERTRDRPGETTQPREVLVVRARSSQMPGARSAVRWMRRRMRVREVADAEGLARAAPAVMHVAAHYRVDAEQPWASAVVLGDTPRPGGRLRAGEVAALRIDVPVVVLAACESARGRATFGEGVLGIASAFLGAGARAVVASAWPVDDGAAARFSRAFYERLLAGASVGEAASAAAQHLRRDPETRAAAYWAAFTVLGDGSVRAPIARRHPGRVAMAAMLVVLAGLVLAARRRAASGRIV